MEFFTTVDFTTPEETIKSVKTALLTNKVVHLRGISNTLDKRVYFEKLADSLGKYWNLNEDLETGKSVEGRWIEIAYDPAEPNRYRSSNTRQPMHTDASYQPIENNIQYLLRFARSYGRGHCFSGYQNVDCRHAIRWPAGIN